jgi:hypothetical protein
MFDERKKKVAVFGLLCFLGREEERFRSYPHLCQGRQCSPQGGYLCAGVRRTRKKVGRFS